MLIKADKTISLSEKEIVQLPPTLVGLDFWENNTHEIMLQYLFVKLTDR